MAQFFNNSIFWIEAEKIKPNPYQPRKDFDENRLQDLADSIKQYGILQPLVVTRTEIQKDDGIIVEYELISGERRLRASKLAGLQQVPVIIRSNTEDSRVKLELAIIENLQREDLNPVDRAKAFLRLVEEFDFKHGEISKKIGRSREYVSNSLRLLNLPKEILESLTAGKISEGHARTLLMLEDRLEEQTTLFKEVVFKKLTVRETEKIARKIAFNRIRKKECFDPELIELEEKLMESLGTRVQIEKKEKGGKILIDFFSNDDLRLILSLLESNKTKKSTDLMEQYIEEEKNIIEQKKLENEALIAGNEILTVEVENETLIIGNETPIIITEQENINEILINDKPIDDRLEVEKKEAENIENSEMYSIRNFSI